MKVKKLTDDDIKQYCESVDRLLSSIKERGPKKKSNKPVAAEDEDAELYDEDIFVMS